MSTKVKGEACVHSQSLNDLGNVSIPPGEGARFLLPYEAGSLLLFHYTFGERSGRNTENRGRICALNEC